MLDIAIRVKKLKQDYEWKPELDHAMIKRMRKRYLDRRHRARVTRADVKKQEKGK